MKKLKLIYNPFSGDRGFKFDLDACVDIFQANGYEVHLFRIQKKGDVEEHIQQMDADYDIIVVSGGDGTINIVVNSLMRKGARIPLGIIPSGTANDFASFLGLKSGKVEEACQIIMETEPRNIDVGIVNGTDYFVNVCAGGLLTNVSQTVDTNIKTALGSLSYYLKGIEQLANFTKLPFRITTSNQEIIEDKFYLYMILNSAGTGGFTHIAPDASITDGKFDFVGIKAKPMIELPMLFIKIFSGELINDSGVVYLRDSYFKIECLEDKFEVKNATLDGEVGPEMPFEVEVLPRAYPVFGKFKY
jgi:diacylglycerol kinase (ATP)